MPAWHGSGQEDILEARRRHFRGEETTSERLSPAQQQGLCSPSSSSPPIQLVPHGVVAVSEAAYPALLARQVLAELSEVALQGTARVLGSLQPAVQPQHTGLLLEELFPLVLGGGGRRDSAPASLGQPEYSSPAPSTRKLPLSLPAAHRLSPAVPQSLRGWGPPAPGQPQSLG